MSSSATPRLHWENWPNDRTREEYERLQLLAAVTDWFTIAHLERLGVAPGWRCLEVGAGAGSIAAWLAERAGPGNVVATDLHSEFLAPLQELGIRVERHDIAVDPPLDEEFDLIHARTVLEHLPTRQEVLGRLRSWLQPGGWLLVEAGSFVPHAAARPALQRLDAAMMDVLARTVGTDLGWARTLPLPLEKAGLTDVGAAVSSPVMRGGDPTARVMLATIQAFAPMLLSSGLVSTSDLDEVAAMFSDPSFVDYSITTIAAWGRCPTRAAQPGTPHRSHHAGGREDIRP